MPPTDKVDRAVTIYGAHGGKSFRDGYQYVAYADYHRLELKLAASLRDRDARAREACTFDGRQGCSFAPSAERATVTAWECTKCGVKRPAEQCMDEGEGSIGCPAAPVAPTSSARPHIPEAVMEPCVQAFNHYNEGRMDADECVCAMATALQIVLGKPSAKASIGTFPDECRWPRDKPFKLWDDPDEHKPCYLELPDGALIPFNYHGVNGVNQAQVKWIMDTLNAAIAPNSATSLSNSERQNDDLNQLSGPGIRKT